MGKLSESGQTGGEFSAPRAYFLCKDTLADKPPGIPNTFILTYYCGCFPQDISSLTVHLTFIAAITKMSAICLQSLSPLQDGWDAEVFSSEAGKGRVFLLETLVYCGNLPWAETNHTGHIV